MYIEIDGLRDNRLNHIIVRENVPKRKWKDTKNKQTLIFTHSFPKIYWILLKSVKLYQQKYECFMICWGKYLWHFGGYFHFSKSQICHSTYPMSPPITFRPWMDKLCENKFLGANLASPALLTSSKVPPEAAQKGAKVWRGRHMRRPFERHLWICLWGAGASHNSQCLQQKKKIHAQR